MDVATLGEVVAPDVAGNPACWHSIYNFDLCCSSRFGPTGNSECWDADFTFNKCCFSEYDSSSCWDDALYFMQSSGDPLAEHPGLQQQENLEKFCCYPTVYSSELCWGAGRPGGSPLLRDSVDGEPLNFTRRFAECCFPRLSAMVEGQREDSADDWMQEQLDNDLLQWEEKGPFSTSDLDDFEAQAENNGEGSKYCRFRVRPQGIFHCDFNVSKFYSLLHNTLKALHLLHAVVRLPNMDFLIHVEESFGAFSAMTPLSVPVLVQAQGNNFGGVNMPWWAFLQLDWTSLYANRMQLKRERAPWHHRSPKLFWRGSDTGCFLEGNCKDVKQCHCSNWTANNWARFPRSRLVLTSMLAPERIDALFTKNIVHQSCADTFNDTNLWVDEIVPPEDHVKYKYLMYIDGASFSDRLYWLMLSESLIFKSASQLRVWIDGALKPWEHYVPVRENLTDLFSQLDWARDNDELAAEIAAKGTLFATHHLNIDSTLHYLYRLLVRVSKLVLPDTKEDEADALYEAIASALTNSNVSNDAEYLEGLKGPMPHVDAQALDHERNKDRNKAIAKAVGESDVSCWSFGFKPEMCCNVEVYGDSGNHECWDDYFTFSTCCVGSLASRDFWRQLDS